MGSWLTGLFDKLRTSFWLVPSLMFVGAIALALLTLWLDRDYGDSIPADAWWLFGGEAEGARQVLSTIASSMMTVGGVVFSITILTLTLATGQFGSRLLQSFMRDTGNQVVLGSFIATFIFCVIVLRSVRTDAVPHLSLSVAMLLVFASVAVLIFFIHHVATKIQAEAVVATVHRELVDTLGRTLPENPPDEPGDNLPPEFDRLAQPVPAPDSGYLQVVEHERLVALCARHDLVVRIPYRPGDFLIEGCPVMHVVAPAAVDDRLRDKLADTMVIGRRRTMTQDAEHGIHQLVEIAVRALSTGINDAFTAINCIDRLAAILCQVSRRHFPPTKLGDEAGRLRVVVKGNDFEGFADAAFNQIRQNAGTNPAVLIRLLDGIVRVAEVTRTDEQRSVLERHADLVLAEGRRSFAEPQDVAVLERRYQAMPHAG